MKRAMFLMVAVAGCADEPVESTGTNEAYAIAYNAIAYNQITTNAIAANRVATDELVAMPLAAGIGPSATGGLTGTFASAAVRLGLEEPNAKTFMNYLVQCALGPDQEITWTSAVAPSFPQSFTGAFGLCPSWYTTTPTSACRQMVSGCILARNNAYGYSVQFSLRGMGETGPQLLASSVIPHNKVPVTKPPITVSSVEPCAENFSGNRDCAWKADKVGICSAGETVVLGAGARAQCVFGMLLGAPGSPMELLRVCPGHTACNYGDSIQSIADCSAPQPRIKFSCPEVGMYSVMQAHHNSNLSPQGIVGSTTTQLCEALKADVWEMMPTCQTLWTGTCDAEWQKLCRYPAPEQRVFRWLEGSFYGDIFGSKNLNPDKPEVVVKIVWPLKKGRPIVVISSLSHDGETTSETADGGEASSKFLGVVFRSMYACSSPNWVTGRAYMERRICAGPRDWTYDEYQEGEYTRDCAAQYVGICRTATQTLEASMCKVYEGLGKEHFAKCDDNKAREWAWPITSVLADRTDAIPDPVVNQVISSAPIVGW